VLTIKNKHDLENVIESGELTTLFSTFELKQAVIEALTLNVTLLTEAYDNDGVGGYICVMTDVVSDDNEANEYLAELAKYNLSPVEWEFDDILGTDGVIEVHMQLFVMTEWSILLVYRKKVRV
jgi:hypothetical protein